MKKHCKSCDVNRKLTIGSAAIPCTRATKPRRIRTIILIFCIYLLVEVHKKGVAGEAKRFFGASWNEPVCRSETD